MAIRKSQAYLSLVNSYLIDSPQPSSISYWYNLGSLLGLCLIIQIASGIFLAMHYSSNIELAFSSVEHIMRDVNQGWLIRYIHANGASFFFICMYLHIGKALYYGSYRKPRVLVWAVGVVIFIATMATAFMGYKNNSPKSYYYINYPLEIERSSRQGSLYNGSKGIFNISQKRDIHYYINPKQDITKPEEIFNSLNINLENYWDNLHDNNIRSQMRSDLKDKSGIYIIINKISRNIYVGSAIKNKLYTRFSNHMLNFHGSKIVKKAILKDGLNNFIFGILEYNLYDTNINNIGNSELYSSLGRDYLYELETIYIKLLQPKYNILLEAKSSIGYKHTDETINKIKSSFTKERRLLLSKLQSDRKNRWSENSINKLRNIALNRPKDYLTKNGRLKISEVNSKIIGLYDINNKYVCKFNSINTTAHYLCTSTKTIQRGLHLGWIYIPLKLTINLNDNYINNNNDLLNSNLSPNSKVNLNKKDLYYINSRNKLSKMKSGLVKLDFSIKYYIKPLTPLNMNNNI